MNGRRIVQRCLSVEITSENWNSGSKEDGYRSGKSRENVHYDDDKSDLHPAESTLRRRTRQEKVEIAPHDSIA